MTAIVLPAARVRQGDLTLYASSVRVRDLLQEGFYSVEVLDPADNMSGGYQRVLNMARAKKLADYVVRGQERQDAFLPTSVLLATDKLIEYNETNHTVSFDVRYVGPFSVVDGQHRLEGLRLAAKKDSRVLDFQIPVNIAVGLSPLAQMCHFLIVNSTQKSVDRSVEQRIFSRLTEALDVEDLPSLPKWILKVAERGEVDKALKLVVFLDESPDSPWKGKVRMANEAAEATTINQRSFVKMVVQFVLSANNPLSIVNDTEKEKKIFLNYWRAIAHYLDDGSDSVLYKYNGVQLFCMFSIPFFTKCQDTGKFTFEHMRDLLGACLGSVEGDYAGVGHPDFWIKGGKASYLNAGAINVMSQELSKALHRVNMAAEIEI